MNFFEIEPYNPGEHGALEDLCLQSQEEGVQMLPLYPDKISVQTNRFVITIEKNAVAYCAQTAEYDNKTAEIGSLIVSKAFRSNRLSVPLAKRVTEEVMRQNKKAIAFCNPISERTFTRVGYVPMRICEIPADALFLCGGCPKRPAAGGCCDRVYVYNEDLKNG